LNKRLRRSIELLKPPPKQTVSEWAVEHRILSAEASAESGKYNLARAPFQKGWQDAISDPRIHTIIGMTSAQVGKTETFLNNPVGYFIAQDPSPILVIQPTLEMAQTWSKDRFAPMLRDCPALKDLVQDPRARDSNNTILHKTFAGGHITMAGANSASSLASRPIRIVFLDEVDRFPTSAGTEGDPVSLAKKRTTTFWNRKIIMTSTPTVKGASRIEQAFLESDQRKYYVPCPKCGEFQILMWSNIRWDQDENQKHLPDTAHYVCAHCEYKIKESDKSRLY
jgi:phage terminase large subunit GpA-like protein